MTFSGIFYVVRSFNISFNLEHKKYIKKPSFDFFWGGGLCTAMVSARIDYFSFLLIIQGLGATSGGNLGIFPRVWNRGKVLYSHIICDSHLYLILINMQETEEGGTLRDFPDSEVFCSSSQYQWCCGLVDWVLGLEHERSQVRAQSVATVVRITSHN